MNPHTHNSKAWIFFCYVSFAIALGATGLGVFFMEISLAMKAFMGMGLLFTTGSAFTLAKTLRDEHEVETARSELLRERGPDALRRTGDDRPRAVSTDELRHAHTFSVKGVSVFHMRLIV